MLTDAQVRAAPTRRRQLPSLESQYHAFVAQRIDGYKESLRRDDLLALGGDALAEMDAGQGQFLLTEMVLAEWVDRLISKRLRLPTFRRWKEQIHKLRDAQRQPTHWGVDPAAPIAALLPRLEPNDQVLVVGPAVESCAYLCAAWDCAVTFVDDDLGSVERVESRVASEALGAAFDAYVLSSASWLATYLERPWALVIVDLGALVAADAAQRLYFLERLVTCTAGTGIHVLVPGGGLAPDAVRSCYSGWVGDPTVARRASAGRAAGEALARAAAADHAVPDAASDVA